MTDREAFDTWALSPAPDAWLGLSERERLFLAWRAATAATQERCAQAVEELDRQKWFSSQRDFAEACVRVIRKVE